MSNVPAPLVLAIRIGVTGARELAADQLPRLRREVADFLRIVRDEITELAAAPGARQAYGGLDATAYLTPEFHLLSPLAEGADRLVAEQALAHGFALVCPTPFPLAEYEKDFVAGESKQEFRALLARAGSSVVQLDGGRGEEQDRSYEAVGRFVVRNCDLLIGIWNGRSGKGMGGTADAIRFATNHGPPVWWIHAERDAAPVWLVDPQDYRAPAANPLDTKAALRSYLARLVLPPADVAPHPHSLLERAALLLRPSGRTPLPARPTPGAHPHRWIWRAHAWLMRAAAGRTTASSPPARTPPDPVARYWFDRYSPADARAQDYARRYRSAYVWVFGLAAAAVVCASLALTVPSVTSVKLTVTGAEFVALALIAVLVVANQRHDWHRRFLEHRLLAELCRKQQVLGPVGWSLPSSAVRAKMSAFLPEEHHAGSAHAESTWVEWLFGALQRAAPLPQGLFDPVRVAAARDAALHDLIDEQLAYHKHRAGQSERAGERLAAVGEAIFLAVLAIVLVKLAAIAAHASPVVVLVLGLAASILPALAAGFVGIRAYAELPLLADQSRRMQRQMAAARRRLQRVDVDGPLASQILGAEIFGIATLMLQDIEGWVQLFRAKIVEPG